MNYATAWFLVSIATGQYIGAMMGCDVPNRPGTYTACPAFDFPKVTVKKP
jgi:hypothetical protein